jgi:hypothetical protein
MDMKIYENMFKRVLTEADIPGGQVNVTPPAAPEVATPSDTDVWSKMNPKIKEKGLEGQFNVEGIPEETINQYTEKIDQWKAEFTKMSTTLEQVYDFATETAQKPGADSIFAETGRLVEELLTGIGTLEGKMKFLAKKIMVAIDKDNKKQRG